MRLPVKQQLDLRSPGARSLIAWQRNVIADNGGEEGLATTWKTILEVATRTKLFIDHLDAWLLEQKTLVNYKRRCVLPVLRERQALADSLVRYLQILGLERRAKPVPSLQEYLASKSREHSNGETP